MVEEHQFVEDGGVELSKHTSKVQIEPDNMDSNYKCNLDSFSLKALQKDYFSGSDFREDVNMENRESIVAGPYAENCIFRSGLYIAKRNAVQRAWKRNGPLGRVFLFLCRSFL